jgi:hypothetical protein
MTTYPFVTEERLRPFANWPKLDPTVNSLWGSFGRAPLHWETPDHEGIMQYYDPDIRVQGSGLRLIPGDFVGVLSSNTEPKASVIVSLQMTNPVVMAAQFIGGTLNGISVKSDKVHWDPNPGFYDINIWVFFVDFLHGSPHQYTLQMVKNPRPNTP